jgi:hypothetical protein
MLNGLKQLELYSPMWALCICAVFLLSRPHSLQSQLSVGSPRKRTAMLRGYLAIGVHQLRCDHQTMAGI